MGMPRKDQDLSQAEFEVLKVLWDLAPATVRDVMNELHARGRKVAYTTVLTFLTRLKQKGFVATKKSGQAYVYKPRVTRDRIVKSRLAEMIDQLFDGAAAPLVLQLMQTESFSADEIAHLRRLIDDLDEEPQVQED
jgi:predicted transcriptional regulator